MKRRRLIYIALLPILCVVLVGAVVLITLESQKASSYYQKIEPSLLKVVSLENIILKDKVETTIILENPTVDLIKANVTVYYEPDLKKYTFNATLSGGTTETYQWTVNIKSLKLEAIEIYVSEYS